MKMKEIMQPKRWSAIVLDEKSHNTLVTSYENPGDWNVFAHHVTIDPFKTITAGVGDTVSLKVTHFGMSDRAFAVKVKGYSGKTNNKFPHVTVYINGKVGAKPKESNDIENWVVENRNIILSGKIENL